MERTDAAMVLPVDIGGTMSVVVGAVGRHRTRCGRQRAPRRRHRGRQRNSYAYARRLVALVGVDDLVVVETDDAVLVARKDRVQQ
jgi:mannose-1-phosphate guanylyltransferase/mannose-6-phosphate isomerase